MSTDSGNWEMGWEVAGMVIGGAGDDFENDAGQSSFFSGGDAGVDAAESGVAHPPLQGSADDSNFAPWEWMKENPELTAVLGSAVAGGAKSYLDTVRSDRDRAEDARQFDTSRRWSGAFYGREAGDGLVARRRS